MKWISFILIFSILLSCKTDTKSFDLTENFQLAVPIIKVDSVIFKNSAEVSLNFGFPDSAIRYTLDGKEVTQDSPVYENPLKLEFSTTIKARGFHNDFKSSEQTAVQLTKITHDISQATIKIEPKPHENYIGPGAIGLIDLQKGNLQFKAGDKWLGFQTSPVTISIELNNDILLSSLKVSCLQLQEGWIFTPKKIIVSSRSEKVGEVSIENVEEKQENKLKVISIPIKKRKYAQLKVVVHSLNEIPQWHQGKGTRPWLFFDEILVE